MKKGVKYFIEQVKKNGLRNVVISPGSRNAPLTIAFSQDKDFKCYSIKDERSAAFVAMGMAQQLKEPVAVLCTSGSALLNYAPAVSEAFYQGIPLIVISADRPSMWVDQGDGQTIRQTGVLKNHVNYELTLNEDPKNDDEIWELTKNVDVAFQIATKQNVGPVHINFPFTEPLYSNEQFVIEEQKHLSWLDLDKTLSAHQVAQLKHEWKTAPKRMIIVGQMTPNPILQQKLIDLASNSSVVVLVENTSNCTHHSFVQCIDRTLNSIGSEKEVDFAPDIIVSIGGAIVSKKIKSFLRRNKAKYHWRIGEQLQFMDTYQSMTCSIPMHPVNFFDNSKLENWDRAVNNYSGKWKQLDFQIQEKHKECFYSAPYSDLSVFEIVLDFIPENSQLHMSNSSVVRYCQLFNSVPSIKRFCNRGTSGIDGSTSTALGAAIAKPNNLITLITGDISFFYDSNALWNNYLKENLKIILINNSGGGIFKIIPGPDSTSVLDEFFTTKQDLSAKSICETHGVNYMSASSLEDIEIQMEAFYAIPGNNGAVVFEVFTPYNENDKVLKDYFAKIKV